MARILRNPNDALFAELADIRRRLRALEGPRSSGGGGGGSGIPLSLIDAAGDLIYGTANDTAARLAIGDAGDILTVAGGVPIWAPNAGIPKTLIDASGDLIQGSAADTPARLARGSDDEVLSVNSSALDYRKIVNAMVDAAAAIDFSKINVPDMTPYTPDWTSEGTQPSLGNGEAEGAYLELGEMVLGYLRVQLGSTSTIGTGIYRFSSPFSIMDVGSRLPVGIGSATESGVSLQGGMLLRRTADTFYLRVEDAGTANVNWIEASAATPFTPGSGDEYTGNFMFRKA